MTRLPRFLLAFAKDQRGATAIEYSLIALFIAVGIIAALGAIGDGLVGIMTAVAAGFS